MSYRELFRKLASEAKFDTDIMFEQISQVVKFNGDKSSASHQPSYASLQRPTEILETFRSTQFTAEKFMSIAGKLDQQKTCSEDVFVECNLLFR